ncbi:MAG: recombination protein RecR, partial [Gammaproteobacteria bacterium]|nr:recombination protein RecR [Gammaproteobacteria bacterium]
MSQSPLIDQLIEALRCLPGVGPKSAQRMAFHLLQHDKERARQLAITMQQAIEEVGHCNECGTLSEYEKCAICADERRDRTMLCVVESPTDVQSIEDSTGFRG